MEQKRYLRREQSVIAIEYGMIAALIAEVLIAALIVLGTKPCRKFNIIATAIRGAEGAVCA